MKSSQDKYQKVPKNQYVSKIGRFLNRCFSILSKNSKGLKNKQKADIFIHPLASVDTQQIGEGTRVWAYTHILSGVKMGRNCHVGEQCFIESGVVVGDNVTIKNGSILWEGVTIEDGVFIGPHVFFTNDIYPRSPRLPQARERYSTKSWLLPILVKKGSSLGAGSIIIAGVEIGEYAMVGAGAVVTKNVPPYALVRGNPARMMDWVCQCGQPLFFDNARATCSLCHLSFQKDNEGVKLYAGNKE